MTDSQRTVPFATPRRTNGPSVPRLVLSALGVFALALLLVTGAELFVGHPLTGGHPGETSMSALFVP
ncbi:hypothetical protein [Actinomycetospora sp. NBRC 106375]|uniref:hypothetical protein n=1 Tax=Actinomycetospora sp. NBRC 106375 TaxID=3032207 RepID=UPI00255736A4|nr:hypothetical protein [Actinomycetospora sp. NBRC 106375]